MGTAPPSRAHRLVLSPHPDDAVLSAWHALTAAADVRVVTVFAGVPERGFVTALDRARGADESAALMQRRREEDRNALRGIGRVPVHCDLLDADYRAFRIPELRARIEREPRAFVSIVADAREAGLPLTTLEQALRDWLDVPVVYAPLGVGGHPDHRVVGALALSLAAPGRTIRLYADVPYVYRHGIPSCIGSGEGTQEADDAIDEAFAALGARADEFEPVVVELTPQETERKIAAFRQYRTEFALVDADFGGATTDPRLMGREVYWTPKPDDA